MGTIFLALHISIAVLGLVLLGIRAERKRNQRILNEYIKLIQIQTLVRGRRI